MNRCITDKGIVNLTNLETIIIKNDGPITNQEMSHLTKLTKIWKD